MFGSRASPMRQTAALDPAWSRIQSWYALLMAASAGLPVEAVGRIPLLVPLGCGCARMEGLSARLGKRPAPDGSHHHFTEPVPAVASQNVDCSELGRYSTP